MSTSDDLITFSGDEGTICILKNDGKVTWAKPEQVDEAAEMFAEAITLGAEYSVGIKKNHRKRLIEDIYTDLICRAESNNGTITTEQLTTALEERMLVNKLKDI